MLCVALVAASALSLSGCVVLPAEPAVYARPAPIYGPPVVVRPYYGYGWGYRYRYWH